MSCGHRYGERSGRAFTIPGLAAVQSYVMKTPKTRSTTLGAVAVVLVLIVLGYVIDRSAEPSPGQTSSSAGTVASSAANTDAHLAQLFKTQASNVQVSGAGTVSRLLTDDNDGSRHQRFILQLDSGQTLLVAHNIDIAPRLNGLSVGDRVAFYGEYVYTDQGGTIHWTHHDPSGTHVTGWLHWNGQKYS